MLTLCNSASGNLVVDLHWYWRKKSANLLPLRIIDISTGFGRPGIGRYIIQATAKLTPAGICGGSAERPNAFHHNGISPRLFLVGFEWDNPRW
jgi:hypothetical protein